MRKRIGETSYKETAFGIIPRSKLIPLEIEGIKRAWDAVLRIRGKKKIPFTSKTFKQLHAIGFRWIFPEHGGNYRKENVQVSHYFPPQFYRIPQLMLDFCRDAHVRIRCLPNIDSRQYVDELIDLLAWAHHRFLWIHPFRDYNGRMSRLLINVILLNFDFPPTELRVETPKGRRDYIDALERADVGDFRKLKRIILQSLEEAARKIN